MDETLLPAIARSLEEEPTRAALAARSTELLPLMEDLLADWRALAMACAQKEPEETVAQLRAVAKYAAETLAELVDGMTWTQRVGGVSATIKLSERDGEWSYCVASADPRADVRSKAGFSSKGAARDGALGELRGHS